MSKITENEVIEKQSILIDKLLDKDLKDSKHSKMKDCFIALLIAIVAIVFIKGYWDSSYDTSNYSNNTINNSDNSLNVGGE